MAHMDPLGPCTSTRACLACDSVYVHQLAEGEALKRCRNQ